MYMNIVQMMFIKWYDMCVFVCGCVCVCVCVCVLTYMRNSLHGVLTACHGAIAEYLHTHVLHVDAGCINECQQHGRTLQCSVNIKLK